MYHATELHRAAYELAMLGLQSDRYANDPDYKDAVDTVLYMTMPPTVKNPVDLRRTVESDLLEDR